MRLPNQNTPGVYKIINIVTGKVYVGSTANLRRRAKVHEQALAAGKHVNPHLQRSWNKRGHKMFRFVILEDCQGLTDKEMRVREQFWITHLDAYRNGYNRNPNATGQPMTDEIKAKISKTKTGVKMGPEARAKMSAARRGKPMSEAHKKAMERCHWSKGPNAAEIGARISATRLAKGLGCTPEMSAKISETKKRQAAEKRAARNRETSSES